MIRKLAVITLATCLGWGCSSKNQSGDGQGVGDGLGGESKSGDRLSDGTRRDGLVRSDAVDPGCLGCHGSTTNLAPPVSVTGKSATSERGVGAHQQHLKSSTWHAPVQCTDCHIVPKTVNEKGHIDTALPAELTWSALAMTDGAKPVWNGTTCSGTYCHGATLSGGTATAPVWTKVDGSQVACTSCHGTPPTSGHVTATTCSNCHGAVVDAKNTIIAPALHIDGKVTATGPHPVGWGTGSVHGAGFFADPKSCTTCHGATYTGGSAASCESCHSGWKTNCIFCHGGVDNTTGAPPKAVNGQTATTVPGVGRHTSHVTASASHVAYACTLCHSAMPTDALTPGHIDPPPGEVFFSGLAAGTTYTFSTSTCSNNYCHGKGTTGAVGSAVWTGSIASCAGCHDDGGKAPTTLAGAHQMHIIIQKLPCSTCHPCVVNSSKQIIDATKHVNGSVQVCGTEAAWDPATRSCSPTCHVTRKW